MRFYESLEVQKPELLVESKFQIAYFFRFLMKNLRNRNFLWEKFEKLLDKSMSIWDNFTHKFPEKIKTVNGSAPNADVAADSYHNWRRDVEMLKELGVTHHRFALSWSRILPYGTPDRPSLVGVDHYLQIFKALKRAGIEPQVTLHHNDLPQIFIDQGRGWLSPKSVDWFGDYADFCFKTFGNYVKFWLTQNQPVLTAGGYGTYDFPPGIGDDPNRYPYQVSVVKKKMLCNFEIKKFLTPLVSFQPSSSF